MEDCVNEELDDSKKIPLMTRVNDLDYKQEDI